MCCHFNQIPPSTLNVLMSMLLLHDLLQRMVCACAIIKVRLGHMNMIIQFSYPCYKFLKKKMLLVFILITYFQCQIFYLTCSIQH